MKSGRKLAFMPRLLRLRFPSKADQARSLSLRHNQQRSVGTKLPPLDRLWRIARASRLRDNASAREPWLCRAILTPEVMRIIRSNKLGRVSTISRFRVLIEGARAGFFFSGSSFLRSNAHVICAWALRKATRRRRLQETSQGASPHASEGCWSFDQLRSTVALIACLEGA